MALPSKPTLIVRAVIAGLLLVAGVSLLVSPPADETGGQSAFRYTVVVVLIALSALVTVLLVRRWRLVLAADRGEELPDPSQRESGPLSRIANAQDGPTGTEAWDAKGRRGPGWLHGISTSLLATVIVAVGVVLLLVLFAFLWNLLGTPPA